MDGFWPTLPEPSEAFVAEMFSVMRKVCICDEDRRCAICYLRVGVGRSHDSIHVADHDGFDLECAKFAVLAASEVISVGFDLDKRG